MKLKSKIRFADEKVKQSFLKIKNFPQDAWLYLALAQALNEIEENAFCGIQIPKKFVPCEYVRKYGVDNCWKKNLPKGWRLMYAIAGGEVIVVSIVLEWLSHKEYDKRFGY